MQVFADNVMLNYIMLISEISNRVKEEAMCASK